MQMPRFFSKKPLKLMKFCVTQKKDNAMTVTGMRAWTAWRCQILAMLIQ